MIKRELSKLLREQQNAIDHHADPLVIERNNEEIWALRNKYACGSTWGKDPAFDKWWVKQVAKARNLNALRKILGYLAAIIFFGWLLYSNWTLTEYEKTHPAESDSEEVQASDN